MGDCPQIGVISYFNKIIWFAYHFYEFDGTDFNDYARLAYEHTNVIFVYLCDNSKISNQIWRQDSYKYFVQMGARVEVDTLKIKWCHN